MNPKRETRWLLLAYTLPRTPSAGRVYIWRKLKKLGAVLLHDALWVLPATASTKEHLQWIAAEVGQVGGEATLWEARQMMGQQDRKLVERFVTAAETAYRAVLDGLKAKRPDLEPLSRRFQQAQSIDYFGSRLGQRARAALIKARGRTS